MIDPQHLLDHAIRPALEHLSLWSEDAAALLLGTAAQESALRYLEQLGGGPALGLFQMEPATHDDILANYLRYRPGLRKRVRSLRATRWDVGPGELAWNLRYAAAMARVHYRRVPEPLPPQHDLVAIASYWKRHYNTELGKGTVGEFLKNFQIVSEAAARS